MRKRRNILWGVVAIAIAALFLLRALNVVPDGLYDIAVRAWPVLLILFGLTTFLRNRVPASSLIALGLSVAIVGGIGVYSFSSRATQQRDDYTQPFSQVISDDITLLTVNLDVLTTDVDVRIGEPEAVTGEFVGSTESLISIEYSEETQGRGVLNVRETRPNPFPMLEAVGRGELRLQLPVDTPVDIVVNSQQGIATLDMTEVDLERLSVTLQQGDGFVTLPEYSPRSPNAQEQPGTLNVLNGNLTVLVPEEVAARLELLLRGNPIEPQYDETLYNFLRGDILENRRIEDMTIVANYVIDIPRGLLTVETVP